MYFNDGEDPWNVEENHIRIFNFDNLDADGAATLGMATAAFLASLTLLASMLLL